MFDAAIAAAAADTPTTPKIVPLVPGLQLHVDGDFLAYFASGNDDTTPGQARQNALSLIASFVASVGASTVIMHNTANGCHKGERYLIATRKLYQGQRKSGRKPKNHGYLQDWLQGYEGDTFKVKNWATREADDGIGACAHYGVGRPPGYVAIATKDKDLRMLPGAHINWQTRDVTRVMPGDFDVVGADGKQYGLKFFFQQMLAGDTADNIPGLEYCFLPNAKGVSTLQSVGPKRADVILEGCDTIDAACQTVIDHYRIGYNCTKEFALDRFCEQAALLWMRCDNLAAVADFARHMGHSRINTCFDQPMWDAVERLERRVQSARDEINSFADSGDALSADRLAA